LLETLAQKVAIAQAEGRFPDALYRRASAGAAQTIVKDIDSQQQLDTKT
jgi:hypothetical protein